MNREFLPKGMIILFFQLTFCNVYGKQEEISFSKGSYYVKNNKEILAYKSDDLPENYNSLNAIGKQNVLWEKIEQNKQPDTTNNWDGSFVLKRLLR